MIFPYQHLSIALHIEVSKIRNLHITCLCLIFLLVNAFDIVRLMRESLEGAGKEISILASHLPIIFRIHSTTTKAPVAFLRSSTPK